LDLAVRPGRLQLYLQSCNEAAKIRRHRRDKPAAIRADGAKPAKAACHICPMPENRWESRTA